MVKGSILDRGGGNPRSVCLYDGITDSCAPAKSNFCHCPNPNSGSAILSTYHSITRFYVVDVVSSPYPTSVSLKSVIVSFHKSLSVRVHDDE